MYSGGTQRFDPKVAFTRLGNVLLLGWQDIVCVFSKISWNSREGSRSFHTKVIYRGYEYLSNNNKTMDMDVDLEWEMKISRRELSVLLLHEFHLGRKATEATSNICNTMGKDVLSIRTAQHWFHRFKNGNFELDDSSRFGWPLQVDIDLL